MSKKGSAFTPVLGTIGAGKCAARLSFFDYWKQYGPADDGERPMCRVLSGTWVTENSDHIVTYVPGMICYRCDRNGPTGLMVARGGLNHRHADFQSGSGGSRGLSINHLQRLPAPSPAHHGTITAHHGTPQSQFGAFPADRRASRTD
jgi:hypothetical protein